MLIGFHGRKQAGKDTIFQRAVHVVADLIPVERVSFADLLYRSAAAALGVTVEQLQEWKTDPRVRVEITHEDVTVNGYAPLTALTVREYLQRYGTEAHRDIFGTDFWVDNVDLGHEGRLVVVTDCRFPNEARAIIAAGGRVVNVVGPDEVENTGDAHASEKPLPAELIWAEIDNRVRDDGFRSLDAQVDSMVRLIASSDARRAKLDELTLRGAYSPEDYRKHEGYR